VIASDLKLSIFAVAMLLAVSAAVTAQWPQTTLARARQIELLKSDRDDVKKAFAEYEASDDDGYSQTFSNEGVDVEVSYSSGKCAEDNDEDPDRSDTWNVPEWRVIRLQVSFDDPMPLKDTRIDVSKFKKKLTRGGDEGRFVLYSKDDGMTINVYDKETNSITVFPSKSQAKDLCSSSTAEKDFYSTEGKFASSIFQPHLEIDVDTPANVTALELDHTEVSATSGKLVTVTTTAVDPENDVLTYNYTVTAGKIRGTGAKVIWDLNGISPGTYSITVGVDDGCGICGQTKTRTVAVK